MEIPVYFRNIGMCLSYLKKTKNLLAGNLYLNLLLTNSSLLALKKQLIHLSRFLTAEIKKVDGMKVMRLNTDGSLYCKCVPNRYRRHTGAPNLPTQTVQQTLIQELLDRNAWEQIIQICQVTGRCTKSLASKKHVKTSYKAKGETDGNTEKNVHTYTHTNRGSDWQLALKLAQAQAWQEEGWREAIRSIF